MKGVLEAVRELFRAEPIEDLPARPVDPFRVGFFPWLFRREALPRDREAAGPRGPRFLAWLLLPEELPEVGDAPAPRGGRSLLGVLFGGETLPHDEEPPGPGPGGRGGAPPARG